MKAILFSVFVFVVSLAQAEDKTMRMNFSDEDITKVIAEYSKMSGQKFIVEASVRGKISIFVQEPINKDEAFNYLSTALAVNGYAISKQDEVMVVRPARSVQRDLTEVVTELPPVSPQKMVTWVVSLKNVKAELVNRELRMLQSKDGELSVFPPTNQLMISDFTPNLHRVAAILKQLDQAVDPAVAALNEKKKRNQEAEAKVSTPAKNKK